MGSGDHQPLWWQQSVIYQIYPRSFQDRNRDGVGDLAGIITRLDYLRDLGVGAVWLSPFYPSPMADFGYDVSDYTDVDPLFGDLPTFDRLLAEMHRRDIKLIVDFVPNHSSDQHPWFKESRASRDNPRRDWYYWRDPKPDGSPPNNWLALFGGSAWEWDEHTGQYYLHSFLKEQPDLNWRNPEVRQSMLDALRFWLERGVDGFRIDVAHFIAKDPELRDNPPNPSDRPALYKPMSEYDTQLHIHDIGHPDVHQYFREIRRLLDEYSTQSPRMAVAEIHEFDWPKWVAYYGENLDEMHMPFNFALLRIGWTAAEVRSVVDGLEGALPAGAWPNYVLGNHDEHRIATRFGPEQARVATMLLLTLRGTPTLYYGDELGMHDVPIPEDKQQDPWGRRVPGFGLGRDPERTPMQWDPSPNAGFCDPDVISWLPVAGDYHENNVEVGTRDPDSMLSFSRSLFAARNASEALRMGSYRPLDTGDTNCFAYVREQGDERWVIALNFGDREETLNLEAGTGRVAISTYGDRDESVDLGQLRLRGNEALLLQTQS